MNKSTWGFDPWYSIDLKHKFNIKLNRVWNPMPFYFSYPICKRKVMYSYRISMVSFQCQNKFRDPLSLNPSFAPVDYTSMTRQVVNSTWWTIFSFLLGLNDSVSPILPYIVPYTVYTLFVTFSVSTYFKIQGRIAAVNF